jgi:predicted RNase H-like HicB family nuclease
MPAVQHLTSLTLPAKVFLRSLDSVFIHAELEKEQIMQAIKIIVEKHEDGYVAYPLGLKGVVVGEGDSYEEALADVKSAIRFHLETFGPDIFETDSPVLEAFVAEAGVALS